MTLAVAIDRGTRVVVAGSVLVGAIVLGFFSGVSQPSIGKYEAGLLALQDSHSAMLDQETGLRGYIWTRQVSVLQPHVAGRADLQAADGRRPPAHAHQRPATDRPAADGAMYRAKGEGCNRVAVAGSATAEAGQPQG